MSAESLGRRVVRETYQELLDAIRKDYATMGPRRGIKGEHWADPGNVVPAVECAEMTDDQLNEWDFDGRFAARDLARLIVRAERVLEEW
jgi:hypothetical protein